MSKFTLTGDFAELQRFIDRLGRAARPAALREVSANLAAEAVELVADGFARQKAPSGKSWAAKRKPDGRSILVGKTARLRRGWHSQSVSAAGFTIAPAVNYAKYHQTGTRRMVARPMVAGSPLPRSWRDQSVPPRRPLSLRAWAWSAAGDGPEHPRARATGARRERSEPRR